MRRSSRLAVPLQRPEDVIAHLGKRHHWKQGHSAKALADFWWGATTLPTQIRAVLDQAPPLAGAELLDGWLERETDLLDGEERASQTDLLALLGVGDALAVLGVEAKAGEPFGPTVFAKLNDGSAGVRNRIEQLCRHLGLEDGVAQNLRYQLLHRTVATLIEAGRFRASKAALLVQSFRDDPAGFEDYQRFVRAIGFRAAGTGTLEGPRRFGSVDLWTGWVDSDVPACGLTIADLRRTTTISPSQWEGRLTDGRPLHIRYRWSQLSVRVGSKGQSADDVARGSVWFEGALGEDTSPMIELPRVLQATGLVLAPDLEAAAP